MRQAAGSMNCAHLVGHQKNQEEGVDHGVPNVAPSGEQPHSEHVDGLGCLWLRERVGAGRVRIEDNDTHPAVGETSSGLRMPVASP